ANFTNQPLPNEHTSLLVEVANIKNAGFGDIQVANEPWITGAQWGVQPGVNLEVFGYRLSELTAANLAVKLISQNNTPYQATGIAVENSVIKATMSNLPQGDYRVEVKYNGEMLPGGASIGFYLPPAPPGPIGIQLPTVQETNGPNTAPAFDVIVTARGTDWSNVAAGEYGVVLWYQGNKIDPVTVTRDVYDDDIFIAHFAAGLAAGKYWLDAYVKNRTEGREFWINSAYPVMTRFGPWAVVAGREYFHLRLEGLKLDQVQNPVVQVLNGTTVVATSLVAGDPKAEIRFRDERTLEADLKAIDPDNFTTGYYDIVLLDGGNPVEKRVDWRLAVMNTPFLYPQVQPEVVPTGGAFTLNLGGEMLDLLNATNLSAKLINASGQPVATTTNITIQSVSGITPKLQLTFAGGLPTGEAKYTVQVLNGDNVIPGTENTFVRATGMPAIYATDYFWGYDPATDTSYPILNIGTYNLSQWGATAGNLTVKIHQPDGTSITANVFRYQDGRIIARLPDRLLPGGYGVEVYVTEQNKVHGQFQVRDFSGDTTAPVVSIIAPAAGETVTDNRPIIKFQSSDEGGSGIYEHMLWLDNVPMAKEDFELISVENNGVVTVKPITAIVNGQHTLALVAMDLNGNFGKSEVAFTVGTLGADTTAPTISGISPIEEITDTRPTIIFTALDNVGGVGVNPDEISVYLNGTLIEGGTYNIITGQYSYTPASDLAVGDYTVTAYVYDYSNNMASEEWMFSVASSNILTVKLLPRSTSVSAGQEFAVDVWVENAVSLTSANVKVAWSTDLGVNLVRIEDGDILAGGQTVKSSEGNTASYARSAPLNPLQGSGKLATLILTAPQDVNGLVSLNFVDIMSDTQAEFLGPGGSEDYIYNFSLVGGAVSLVSGLTLTGKVTLQSKSKMGQVSADFSGTIVRVVGLEGEYTTDSDGMFTIPGLAPRSGDQSYSLIISHTRYLKEKVDNIELTETSQTPIDVMLRAGDANNDSKVSLTDLFRLSSSFNQVGDFDADFNFDGKVSLTDLYLLSQNFNTQGYIEPKGT
ncbi:MAG: dockerin type I domain-containing protein, partial [Bacillota bacterium]